MKSSLLFIVATIALWGLWGFLSKLAVGRIGIQSSLWNSLSLTITVVLFLIFTNQMFPIRGDATGISLAILAGVFSGLASAFFFLLLQKKPVGFLIAVTALYPLVTIILSVIFLKEPLTLTRIIGFVFALAALILLNL